MQDVQWGPGGSNKGNKFVVIAGSMPSTSTLYNIKVRGGGGGGGVLERRACVLASTVLAG